MNYIVFSVYGSDKKYLHGACWNAERARDFYPGWRCVFFVDDVLSVTASHLRACDAIVTLPLWPSIGGMYWRHCFPDLPNVSLDRYIVRDVDSRLSWREREAVMAWVDSGKTFHLMRDHPGQSHPVMQGMYGVLGNALAGISSSFKDVPNVRGGADALFQQLYDSKMKGNALEHGEFHKDKYPLQVPFPSKRVGVRFVGEIFDENDRPNEDWKQLP